ncbi:MAG: DUF2721 domain-containing protein [Proteobacteria bacterium]|nr:DUF2721 domain-containing protein [Pseudomonadota bacterium]MBU1058286.1 DUF2721 domain-containing protein [Pseudomonadota bacterium]
MEITITTPALLFPAVTFLLVAYTNRFLAIGSRIRNLHDRYHDQPDEVVLAQIASLRHRAVLIRNMQACGVAGLFLCVFCILVLFAGWNLLGQLTFAASLFLLLASLSISLQEIFLSMEALNLELGHMEAKRRKGKKKT